MSGEPLAFHITFGTYGTRLHGGERPTVDRRHNTPGEPFLGLEPPREGWERSQMRSEPVRLTREQQRFAEQEIPALCEQGGWTYHVVGAGPDHVHVLLSAGAEGKTIRRLLKRWLGQALSQRWPRPSEHPWWAEGGSVKYVWNPAQFDRVLEYVARQRATEIRSEPGRPRPGESWLEDASSVRQHNSVGDLTGVRTRRL